jgi:nucleoside-diphosphate-sugar epimerase
VNILITGGTGFLGSALVKHWVRAGHKLTLLVRQESSLERLALLLPDVQLINVFVNQDMDEIVRGVAPDAIVHTACAYGRRHETALQLVDANIRLGLSLLDALLKQKTEHVAFINAGTSLQPTVSGYALSKIQFSQWGETLSLQHPNQLQFVNIRLQHMYGPGDDVSKFPTQVLHACHRNQAQLALTAGEQRRDLIYIDDVVSAYDVLLNNKSKLLNFEEVDVGSGHALPIRHFVETIHELTKSRTELLFGAIPYRANEAMYCQADIGRMNLLNWKPAYSLKQGILKTIELEFKI